AAFPGPSRHALEFRPRSPGLRGCGHWRRRWRPLPISPPSFRSAPPTPALRGSPDRFARRGSGRRRGLPPPPTFAWGKAETAEAAWAMLEAAPGRSFGLCPTVGPMPQEAIPGGSRRWKNPTLAAEVTSLGSPPPPAAAPRQGSPEGAEPGPFPRLPECSPRRLVLPPRVGRARAAQRNDDLRRTWRPEPAAQVDTNSREALGAGRFRRRQTASAPQSRKSGAQTDPGQSPMPTHGARGLVGYPKEASASSPPRCAEATEGPPGAGPKKPREAVPVEVDAHSQTQQLHR